MPCATTSKDGIGRIVNVNRPRDCRPVTTTQLCSIPSIARAAFTFSEVMVDKGRDGVVIDYAWKRVDSPGYLRAR